jgi:hypothetical protein
MPQCLCRCFFFLRHSRHLVSAGPGPSASGTESVLQPPTKGTHAAPDNRHLHNFIAPLQRLPQNPAPRGRHALHLQHLTAHRFNCEQLSYGPTLPPCPAPDANKTKHGPATHANTYRKPASNNSTSILARSAHGPGVQTPRAWRRLLREQHSCESKLQKLCAQGNSPKCCNKAAPEQSAASHIIFIVG